MFIVALKRIPPFVILLILLGACTPGSQPVATINPPQIWQISRDPALAWMEPDMNGCIQPLKGLALSVASSETPQTASIHLTWGETPANNPFIYQIGQDQLVLIVNKENPLKQVDMSTARSIMSGTITNWKNIDPNAAALADIQLWHYLPQTHLRSIFAALFDLPTQPLSSNLAPDPAAMRQAITAHPSSIGWIPGKWLTPEVNTLAISDLPADKLTQPVLAYFKEKPGEIQSAWLICLEGHLSAKP